MTWACLRRSFVALGVALLVVLVPSSASWAVEGPAQETETICSGGSQYAETGNSGGQARYAFYGNGAIECPLPAVASGSTAVVRLYGRKQGVASDATVIVAGVSRSASYPSTSPTVFQSLLFTSDPYSGPATTMTVSSASGEPFVVDFFTVEALEPPAPSPAPVEPAPSPSPSSTTPAPAPSPSEPAPATSGTVTLDGGQYEVLSFGLGLLVFLSAASFVGSWRK